MTQLSLFRSLMEYSCSRWYSSLAGVWLSDALQTMVLQANGPHSFDDLFVGASQLVLIRRREFTEEEWTLRGGRGDPWWTR